MVVYGLANPDARKIGYRLLEFAVRECWGLEQLPEIVREERGKPVFAEPRNCHFNLSHSGQWVVCGVDYAPVGIDIQQVRPCREELLKRVCSPEEQDWYRARGSRAEDFSLLWAMKESKCKFTGEGLKMPISDIQIPLPKGEEGRLELDGLSFYLKRGENWQFCLCTRSKWDGDIHWIAPGDTTHIKE